MNTGLIQLVTVVSVFHIAYAMIYFFKSGKSLLLFSDSFVFASAVFFGLPGWLTCLLWPFWINSDYLVVSLLGVGFSLAVTSVSVVLRKLIGVRRPAPRSRSLGFEDFKLLRILTWISIISAVLSTLALLAGAPLGPVPANLGFLAVLLSFTHFWTAKNHLKSFPNRFLIPLTMLLVLAGYLFVYFDGGGRLIVATMFYALAGIAGIWDPRLPVKKGVLLSLIPAIMFFGYIRGNTGDFKDVLVAADGLESVFSPYQTCATLVNHIDNGIMPLQYLGPLKSTIFFWVPRFLWPQKPFGFGFELTRHFHPELVFQEHSMAATYIGEIFASIGWVSVILGLLVLVLGIAWLDLKMVRLIRQHVTDWYFLIRMLVFAILSAGIFDFVWVGSFTFFSRNILRLFLLFGLIGIVLGMRFLVASHRSRFPEKWA